MIFSSFINSRKYITEILKKTCERETKGHYGNGNGWSLVNSQSDRDRFECAGG